MSNDNKPASLKECIIANLDRLSDEEQRTISRTVELIVKERAAQRRQELSSSRARLFLVRST